MALHPNDEREIQRVRNKVDRIRGGPGIRVKHERDGIVVSLFSRKQQGVAATPATSFWAKITGSLAMDGASNRWQYAWSEQVRTATGWETPAGGRSGTTEEGFALNSVEANNDGAGVQGHGVDIDGADYPAGFALKPIRGEPVRRMWQEIDTDGNVCYSFEATNTDDGTCEAP